MLAGGFWPASVESVPPPAWSRAAVDLTSIESSRRSASESGSPLRIASVLGVLVTCGFIGSCAFDGPPLLTFLLDFGLRLDFRGLRRWSCCDALGSPAALACVTPGSLDPLSSPKCSSASVSTERSLWESSPLFKAVDSSSSTSSGLRRASSRFLRRAVVIAATAGGISSYVGGDQAREATRRKGERVTTGRGCKCGGESEGRNYI